ncbi:nephrin-like isoform X3 [Cotesia glomerata]|uniref:nephrin-like isoform X3 n=1 Tax=Cotesia glomerata TaxID=32391 RepID=UPI001D0107B7|nr:nephrin-like isoform X3 [Cotesia glomerata]
MEGVRSISGDKSRDSIHMMVMIILVGFFISPIVKGDTNQQYFKVRPINSSVQEGGRVMIPCVVGKRMGIVQWAKDGFAFVIQPGGSIVGYPRLKLEGDQNSGVYNLTIRDASLTDDGEYQCQVGPYGKIKAIRANANLVVISPPQTVEISNYPNHNKIELKVGESTSLECTVSYAKPAATIVWYRGNHAITGGETSIKPISIEDDKDAPKPGEPKKKLQKYDTHSSITIVPTVEDDGTDYACEARHPAIPLDRPMRAVVKLSVLYPPGPPYIEGYTEGETVQRGQRVDLVCKSRGGNPPAQVVWFRNDEVKSNFYRTDDRISQNLLTFEAKSEDDKARYRCEVSNVMSVTPLKVHVDLSVLFHPASVIITGPTEAKAEETVTIICTTENSNPPAEIKWTVAGSEFHTNNSRTYLAPQGGYITTSNITFNINPDAKSVVVICQATNKKLADYTTKAHTINVIYPPASLIISGYEDNTTIDAGVILKLLCIATAGNPLANVTWYKNDKEIKGTVFTRDHAVTNELEMLVNASDNNAHIRCDAINSATTIPMSKKLILKVHFPTAQVKITREPEEFRAGRVGKLICESSASNPPAEMSWWKGGLAVEGTKNTTRVGLHGGFVSTVEFQLQLTEDMNEEVYTCEARNAVMQRSTHDATALNVLFKPIFSSMDPSELVGMEGEPYVISVTARGNPSTINFTWTRDGLPLSRDNSRIKARDSTLNITRLHRNDAGTYVCQATNKEGSSYYQLNLTVQYAAEIKRTSESGAVYSPDTEAKLFCELDGSPIGDEYVTWYKVGLNSGLSNRYSTSFANKTSFLHISNPSVEDVGEYRCNVNNGIGNVTSKPILFITNFEPQITNNHLTRKAAANVGSEVKLHCRARGSPLPKFIWTFGDKTLSPNVTTDKYKIVRKELSKLEAQSTLSILRVTQRDYGKYNCRASNSMGQITDFVQLDVTSPPDKPTDLQVSNVTHDSVTLNWKKGFDGGLPTSYRIRWRQALDYQDNYDYRDISAGQTTATIDGLTLGTYYVFSIMARNSKGESPYLPDLVKVQTLRLDKSHSHQDLLEKSDFPMNYIYTVAATSIIFFIINLFIMLWYIVRKKNKAHINKSQTADMYAPSTVNGDTMTGELSSVSDEKSDVNFDANDYVDEGRKTAASTYLIDQSIQDFNKGGLEMQVHHQGTLGRRINHVPSVMPLDSPPQRTTASGTLSVSKSSYIGNPSPAPPSDVNFYSVEMDSGRYMGYETNPSPVPVLNEPGPGAYYPSLGSGHHHVGVLHTGANTGTLTRNRTLPRPVPPPDVTVMTAGTKSPQPPSVPPPPITFARAGPIPVHSHGHPLSTFTSTPNYSDIDGHLV